MKKNAVAVICLLLLVYFQGQAQGLKVGFKGGASFSNLFFSDMVPKTKVRYGFVTGISVIKQFSDKLNIRAELLYQQKGFTDHLTFTDNQGGFITTEEFRYQIDYITLPLLVRVFNEGETGLYIDLGLSPAFLVRNNGLTPGVEKNSYSYINQKFNSNMFHAFNLACVLGMGYQFKLSEEFSITFEGRVNQNFFNLYKSDLFGNTKEGTFDFSVTVFKNL